MNSDQKPTVIMNYGYMNRAILRIAHQILEATHGKEQMLVFGINHRGLFVAEQLAAAIGSLTGTEIDVYGISVEYSTQKAQFDEEQLPDWSTLPVVLVDDVIFSGITMYRALELFTTQGIPEQLMTAALVDRGHRKLPIHCDFYGLHYPTKLDEQVFARVGNDQHQEEPDVVLVHSPYDAESLKSL